MMSPQDETNRLSDISADALSEGGDQTVEATGKKPFLEPTVSISLNILDATAFFQGSTALDTTDL